MTTIKEVEEESTAADILKVLTTENGNNISLLMTSASFAPKCKALMKDMPNLSSGGCCGGESPDVTVYVMNVDCCDDLEEAAIELGMKDVPSYQVYCGGKLVTASSDGEDITIDSIRAAVESACNASSGCCAPPSNPDDVRKMVSGFYADTVNKTAACCVSGDSRLAGYSEAELQRVGADANLGLGCGNPTSFANLSEGEIVVDLGSGAGIDCFLAADKVGPTGQVIGVDMTPDMIHKARDNVSKRPDSRHVQFRLGEIEYLPVADDSVDCILSNCVINLSPDKAQVYREMFRILREGGRIAISDVVNRPQMVLPEELKTAEALACWVSGAPEIEDLEGYLKQAGFTDIKIAPKESSREVISKWMPGSGAEDYVISAEITAVKPSKTVGPKKVVRKVVAPPPKKSAW